MIVARHEVPGGMRKIAPSQAPRLEPGLIADRGRLCAFYYASDFECWLLDATHEPIADPDKRTE
jgi:hypothetical protein